jgi:PKD repeat protein
MRIFSFKKMQLNCVLMIFLFLSQSLLHAQVTIPIIGDTEVCINATKPYNVNPTTGINYTWTVVANGNISGTNIGDNVNATWNIAGSGVIQVQGRNASNVLVETGNLVVNVLPLPIPLIDWDARVGCQIVDTSRKNGEKPKLEEDIDDGVCIRVCENSIVTYWVTNSTGGPILWDVPSNGTIVSLNGDSCTVQWGAPGFATISVSLGYPSPLDLCVGTREICIEIIASPKAAFEVMGIPAGNPLEACQNQPVYFLDQSSQGSGSPLVSWYWDFGDGYVSSSPNPVHTYTNSGGYMIMLVVTNECNCKDTFYQEIKVHENDNPIEIYCPSVVCEGGIGTYTIKGGDIDRIKECLASGNSYWEVVGGTIIGPTDQITIQIVWDNVGPDGFGYLIYHPGPDCGQCPAPTVTKIPVILINGTISGETFVCPNQKQYRYSLPQWPATVFNWSISTSTGAVLAQTDQTNEIMLITDNPGTVTITATYNNTLIGCVGTASITVQVTNPITVSGVEKACEFTNETYSLPAGYSGDWTVNGPGGFSYNASSVNNINLNFGPAGSYVINVNGNFCIDEPFIVEVQGLPASPNFIHGVDSICPNVPYEFTAGDPIPGTIFEWSIIGGTLAGQTGNTVTATFAGPGPYEIQVLRRNIKSPNCASDLITKQLFKTVINVAITGPTNVCPNSTSSYNATYLGGETYEWSIDNTMAGSVSSGKYTPNATILWNNTTTTIYTNVKLTMRKCGENYVVTLPVVIYAIPVITLSAPPSICDGSLLTINVIGAGGSSVTWTYTGGGTATGNPFSEVMDLGITGNSTYTFTASIHNPGGCPGVINKSINIDILPKPSVTISPSTHIGICPPDPINVLLTATMQVGFEPTTQLDWLQGSLVVATCNTPTFSCNPYPAINYGSYRVVATSANGCTDTSKSVSIIPLCPDTCVLIPNQTVNAHESANDHCGEFTISQTHTGTPLYQGFLYDASDLSVTGTTASSMSFRAKVAGIYEITYYADYISNTGDTCRKTKKVTVHVPLITDIMYSATCAGNTYNITAKDFSNKLPATVINNYTFYLTGTSSTTFGPVTSPTHTFTGLGAGGYNVQIKINYTYAGSTYDCYSAVIPMLMPVLPVANFNVVDRDPACVEYPVSFINTSTPGSGLSYMWSFGDGTQNTTTHPHRAYTSSGNMDITLTATNEYGCYSSITKNVRINSNMLGGEMIVSPGATVCQGTPINIGVDLTGFASPSNYSWMNDTTNILNTTYQPVTVTQSGSYWVTLTNGIGCVKSLEPTPVTVIAMPDISIVGNTYYCEGTDVVLDGYAGQGMSYQWHEASIGTLFGYTNPTLTYAGLAPGNYDFMLTVVYTDPITGIACNASSSYYPVTVSTPPAAPSIDMGIYDCDKYIIKLGASHSDPGTFTWSNGLFGPDILVTDGGPYKVWFNNGLGCISSATIDVPRNPEDYLWMFPIGCYNFCKEDLPKTLYGPIVPFNYWEWYHDGGNTQSGSGYVDPYDITDGGVYNLTLKNQFCGRTSGDMDVTLRDCRECKLEGRIGVYCVQDEKHGCLFYATISINNGTPYIMNVNLSSPMGSFAPTSLVLYPGINTFTIQFYPNASYVSGLSIVHINGSYYDYESETMQYCYSRLRVSFPENCCGSDQKPTSVNELDKNATGLQIIPNPARDNVSIAYTFDSQAKEMQLELYDLTGRRVKSVNINQARGVQDWNFNEMPAGLYIVLMRQDGKVVHQSKLSVTK